MMNAVEIINAITKDQIRTDLPELEVGSTVKVYQKIVEGSRTRTQMFEGTVIAKHGGGIFILVYILLGVKHKDIQPNK